jgi:hypothetical protein
MSAPPKSKSRKRGRPIAKLRKVRQNITFTPEIVAKAKVVAFSEGMALSQWLERLVREKLQKTGK